MEGNGRHDRYTRVTRLAEVGAVGQARIGAAAVRVELDGLAGRVAARYLAGAGVGHLLVRSAAIAGEAAAVDADVRVEVAPVETAPLEVPEGRFDEGALGLRDPAAAAIARGAMAALRSLHAALEGAE